MTKISGPDVIRRAAPKKATIKKAMRAAPKKAARKASTTPFVAASTTPLVKDAVASIERMHQQVTLLQLELSDLKSRLVGEAGRGAAGFEEGGAAEGEEGGADEVSAQGSAGRGRHRLLRGSRAVKTTNAST